MNSPGETCVDVRASLVCGLVPQRGVCSQGGGEGIPLTTVCREHIKTLTLFYTHLHWFLNKLNVVLLTFNPSTQEAEQVDREFQGILVYIVNFRQVGIQTVTVANNKKTN